MGPLVELRSVGVTLGGRPVIEKVDLTIEPGQAIGVVGPNGSGKTTLLRLIATLIRPSSGHGSVMGHDLLSPRIRHARREIGFISHAPSLLEELTLEENLGHFVKLTGADEEGIDKAFGVVGLENARSRRVSECSYGMKRRLEVAWLLMAKPRLVLLDEAKSGLDSEAQALIDAVVDLTVERGGGVASVSHDKEQLDASRIAPIHQIQHGTLKAIR